MPLINHHHNPFRSRRTLFGTVTVGVLGFVLVSGLLSWKGGGRPQAWSTAAPAADGLSGESAVAKGPPLSPLASSSADTPGRLPGSVLSAADENREEAVHRWIDSLRPSEVPALLDALLRWTRESGDHRALHLSLQRWAESEPEAAYAFVWSRYPPDDPIEAGVALRYVLEAWAAADLPQAAVAVAQLSGGDDSLTQAAYAEIANAFLTAAPEAGRAWVAALPAGPARRGATQAFVLRSLADVSVVETQSWLGKLTSDPDASEAIERWVAARAIRNPVETLAWASSLAPGPARQRALRAGLASWAYAQPQEALDWAFAHATDANELDWSLAGFIEGAHDSVEPADLEAILEAVASPSLRRELAALLAGGAAPTSPGGHP